MGGGGKAMSDGLSHAEAQRDTAEETLHYDQSWTKRLPPVLAARLQELLDSPEG